VWNERSLRRTLKDYFAYYQRSRTHLALAKDAPESRVGRPIKNIRFISGDGRSAGRRCQSPERSGARRGAEASTARFWGMRRAELTKRDWQKEPTGAPDFAVKRMWGRKTSRRLCRWTC